MFLEGLRGILELRGQLGSRLEPLWVGGRAMEFQDNQGDHRMRRATEEALRPNAECQEQSRSPMDLISRRRLGGFRAIREATG